MNIDPRIASRLRATFEKRIDDFDAEADHLLQGMISECSRMGEEGFPSFSALADRLEEYRKLLKQHPARSQGGKKIRENLIQVSNDLSNMFTRLADIAAEKG
ncbi:MULTISPECIES: hypothetical protein [unclassified Roseibium]|uniref:hypothetical protein n=1 Tax=unclassified Roseibium TaxID=2629323 RepID=UPI00273FEED1|nr:MULTISPECIES: hypothetical protein [unclassified Roseibium]